MTTDPLDQPSGVFDASEYEMTFRELHEALKKDMRLWDRLSPEVRHANQCFYDKHYTQRPIRMRRRGRG